MDRRGIIRSSVWQNPAVSSGTDEAVKVMYHFFQDWHDIMFHLALQSLFAFVFDSVFFFPFKAECLIIQGRVSHLLYYHSLILWILSP